MNPSRSGPALVFATALAVLPASTASAQVIFLPQIPAFSASMHPVMMTYEDVVESLKQAGYEILLIESTMLRRKRIVARNDEGTREIIVTRSTGEILHDVTTSQSRRRDNIGTESMFDSEGKLKETRAKQDIAEIAMSDAAKVGESTAVDNSGTDAKVEPPKSVEKAEKPLKAEKLQKAEKVKTDKESKEAAKAKSEKLPKEEKTKTKSDKKAADDKDEKDDQLKDHRDDDSDDDEKGQDSSD